MKTSVIISTYESPDYLALVLAGYGCQTVSGFELVIADDGSGDETRHTIDNMSATINCAIKHIWQPDEGFRKTAILNKAISEASGDYLIFTDGDCIPRADFVEVHFQNAESGRFLSGGATRLPRALSNQIVHDDIIYGRVFKPNWLRAHGMKVAYFSKVSASGAFAMLLNRFSPTRPTFNGGNASAFKSDVVAVNGFDERTSYGGEDREIGERLENAGIAGKSVRYKAICVHLDHDRDYVDPAALVANRKIRDTTRNEKRRWTDYGIVKGNDGAGRQTEFRIAS